MQKKKKKKPTTTAGILTQGKLINSPISRQLISEAAQVLGRKGGKVGGPARAEAIGDRTHHIAVHAACARWGLPCHCRNCK